jgi:hypothetical protein
LNAHFATSQIDQEMKDILFFELVNSEFGERYYDSDSAKVQKSVALKKVQQHYYQIFHRYYDCGWNYSLQEWYFDILNSKIVEVETWVARRPC